MQAPATSRCISVNVLDWFPTREPCVDWPTIFGHRPTREPRNLLITQEASKRYSSNIHNVHVEKSRSVFYYKFSLVDYLFVELFDIV